MQGLLDRLSCFTEVAAEKSFRGAARRLGVSPAAVSKTIARLESDLGARLFHRNTRRLELTPAGEVFLARCREAVARLEIGRELMELTGDRPSGLLRVSASPALGSLLGGQVADFLSFHPGVRLRLDLGNRLADLPNGGIDAVVRLGRGSMAGVTSRVLCRPWLSTVASPRYLTQHGTPTAPDNLLGHNCLRLALPNGACVDWTFAGPDGEPTVVAVAGNLEAEEPDLLVHAALAGAGIGHLLSFLTADHITAGRLVEVLEPYRLPAPPVHALCLAGNETTPKVRAFFDFLEVRFGALAGAASPPGGW